MNTAFKTTLALTAVALASQAFAQVTFYEREGFQGESFTTRRQIGNFERAGFNDRASSVIVVGEPGERWQVCEDVRFGGTCAILQPGQYPSLRAMGLNNRISSVQVVARAEAPPARGRIVFYEREGLSGRSFATETEVANFSGNGFNDRISSVEVFGAPWEVCRDSGFNGPCVVLRAGQYPSLSAMGLNNSISSVRSATRNTPPPPVAATVIFYERESFGGRSFTTQGDVADFRQTGFNDRASSVEVTGGWFEACQDTGYSGNCVLLRPGKYPSLIAMGLDNRISSVRVAANRDLRVQESRVVPAQPISAPYDPRRRGDEQLYEADVVAVRAVVGPPEQRCWVDRDQVVQEQSRSTNVPATIIGAVIGGILGHQVGDGRGRDIATVGGAVAGGAIGATVGRDGRPVQTQEVQRCATVAGPVRADLWDVTYNFRGQEHRVQMTTQPGSRITVNRDGEPRI